MAVKLNETAYDHARDLIAAGRYVIDDRDAWSEHQPSARQENDYIERHGIAEYARWHLGIPIPGLGHRPQRPPITYRTRNGRKRIIRHPSAADIEALRGKDLACYCPCDGHPATPMYTWCAPRVCGDDPSLASFRESSRGVDRLGENSRESTHGGNPHDRRSGCST